MVSISRQIMSPPEPGTPCAVMETISADCPTGHTAHPVIPSEVPPNPVTPTGAPTNRVILTGAYQKTCHPDWSVYHPCHPDWSVSGMEGSTAVGTKHGSARIPPLRFAPVGMTRGVVQSECLPPLSSRAKSRDLLQLVRCRGVRGFLHYASLRSE